MVEKHGGHLAHPDLEAKPKDPNPLWDQFNAVVDALDHLGDHLEAMVTPPVKKLPLFLKGSIYPENIKECYAEGDMCPFYATKSTPHGDVKDYCIVKIHPLIQEYLFYICVHTEKVHDVCRFKADTNINKIIVKKINDTLHQDTPPVKKEDTILKPPPLFRKGEYCPFRRGEGCSNIVYRYCTHTDEKCRFIDDYTEATP
jgi:hypothetical protein